MRRAPRADEELDWEDVDAPPSSADKQAADEQSAQHWRERMARRQRYWSMNHGFKLGRKLGDWGQGAAPDRECALEEVRWSTSCS